MLIIHVASLYVASSTECVWPYTSQIIFHCSPSTTVLPFSIYIVLILFIWIQIWMMFQRFDDINPTEDFIYKMPSIHTKQISTWIKAFHTCLYNRSHDKINRFIYDVCVYHNFGYCIFSQAWKFASDKVFIDYSYKIISNYSKMNRYYQANPELLIHFSFWNHLFPHH